MSTHGGDDEAEAAAPAPTDVADLVASTVLSAFNSARNTDLAMRDVNALVPKFYGNSDEDVASFIDRVQSVQDLNNVDETLMKLNVIGKLDGKAKKWFDSRPSNVYLSLEDLLDKLKLMFTSVEDKVALFRKFEARKWGKNEQFSEYFNDKVTLGYRLNLEEPNLITYLIEGFNHPMLQMQTRLKEFSSLESVLKVMSTITNSERYTGQQGVKTEKPRETQRQVGPTGTSQSQIKCYNCNQYRHVANKCAKPKRASGTCFECGSSSHQIRDCPRKKNTPRFQPDSTTLLVQEGVVLPEACRIDAAFHRLGIQEQCILDSGSPVSLISVKLIPPSFIEDDNYCNLNL